MVENKPDKWQDIESPNLVKKKSETESHLPHNEIKPHLAGTSSNYSTRKMEVDKCFLSDDESQGN